LNRTLKRSGRPFVVFAVMLGLVSLLGFYNYFTHGRRTDLLEAALLPMGMYVVLAIVISSVSVTVSDTGITVRRWLVSRQFIPFTDIDHSEVQYLAERDWPVWIKIHGRHRLLVQLGLKGIQRADAEWLCALPELKCRVSPGLTRRT
jgi:hypothetical protein